MLLLSAGIDARRADSPVRKLGKARTGCEPLTGRRVRAAVRAAEASG